MLANRTTPEFLEGIDACWVRIFGPMQVLIFDGETGLNDEEAEYDFRTKGIKKKTLRLVNTCESLIDEPPSS